MSDRLPPCPNPPSWEVDWPALDRAFCAWLDPSNFDERGRQRTTLGALTSQVLVSRG